MNCIIIDDDKLSRRIIEEYIKKTESICLAGSFNNATEAINFLRNDEPIDLIFLDIEMPEMTGIEFLGSLTNIPQVIIVSSKEKYALNAFDYDVTDYILKPVSYPRFIKAIDKAIERYNKQTSPNGRDCIFVKRNFSLIKLKFSDILWIEALENYVSFFTFNDKFTVHFTLKAIEKKLSPKVFLRVHRSYIVNINAIEVIEDNSIAIKNNEGIRIIPIGKSYRDKLLIDINSLH